MTVSGLQRRSQIRLGRRPALALPDRHVERPNPLLLMSVVVARDVVARLSTRLDKGTGQQVLSRASGNVERPTGSPPLSITTMST